MILSQIIHWWRGNGNDSEVSSPHYFPNHNIDVIGPAILISYYERFVYMKIGGLFYNGVSDVHVAKVVRMWCKIYIKTTIPYTPLM